MNTMIMFFFLTQVKTMPGQNPREYLSIAFVNIINTLICPIVFILNFVPGGDGDFARNFGKFHVLFSW